MTNDGTNNSTVNVRHTLGSAVRRSTAVLIAATAWLPACAAEREDASSTTVSPSTVVTAATVSNTDAVDLGAIDEFSTIYTDAAQGLRPTLFFYDDPWLDLGVAIDAHRDAVDPLGELLETLPAIERIPGDLRPLYQDVLDAIADWRSDVLEAADELERRSDELSPLAADWTARIADGADEPPPAEIRELIDAGREGADRLGQACTELATRADVVVDCFTMFAEPGSPDPGAGPAEFTESGTVAIDVDGAGVAIDVVDASGGTGFGDRAAFDLGPGTRLWVLPAPDVRDPAAGDGTSIDAPIPWPDDLDGWLDDLGLVVTVDEAVERRGRAFRHVVVDSTGDVTPLLVNDVADTGTIDIPADAPLHLWITDIDGTPLVATLAIGIPDDEDLFVTAADDVIATIRTT